MKHLDSLKRVAYRKQREEQHVHGAKRQTDVHKHAKKYDRKRDNDIKKYLNETDEGREDFI